jgi:cation:H+ antiporter
MVGLVMLVLGARWLLEGAVELARAFGVSELVIGLTLVAAGTSLPELATSVVASLKGQRDIAIGNIVGSNIFNILSVLGVSALVAPDGVPVAAAALRFDIPVMIAVAVVCLPVFVSGGGIARWEGAVFLAYYAAYVTYLALDATRHPLLPAFSHAMWLLAIPATVIALAVSTARTLRARSPKP